MNNSHTRLHSMLTAIILVVASLSFSSCSDEDDPYYSPLVGAWQLSDYSGDGNYYLEGLVLYDDGSGYVTGYNDYGAYDSWDIWWSSLNGSILQVTFTDGYGDSWTYYYNFNGGYLHLKSVDAPYSEYWYVRC